MLVLLRSPLAAADRDRLTGLARELRLQPRFLGSEERILELVAGETGAPDPSARSRFEQLTCVASVLDGSDVPERHARHGQPDRRVEIAGRSVGAGHFLLIGGPCAVESEPRLAEIARSVAASGAGLLRGGAYKPRTSPYSFQGLGHPGLAALAAVREKSGLGIVTEVLDPRDVEAVVEAADMLQVGSRNMDNFALLREVGRANRPVLLKRGLGSTVREFLLAAEYVLAEGNEQLVLCERGVRGFDKVTRNLLDVGAIAYLKRATHLPVIADPSHAAGRADLVLPLAKAAVAAGADGLIVEVHPNPAEVHSDGSQAVSLEDFAALAAAALGYARLEGKTSLDPESPTAPRETTPSTLEGQEREKALHRR